MRRAVCALLILSLLFPVAVAQEDADNIEVTEIGALYWGYPGESPHDAAIRILHEIVLKEPYIVRLVM